MFHNGIELHFVALVVSISICTNAIENLTDFRVRIQYNNDDAEEIFYIR